MDIGRRAYTFTFGRRYYAILLNEDGLVTDDLDGIDFSNMSTSEMIEKICRIVFNRPDCSYDPHMGAWWALSKLDRDRLDSYIDDNGYRRCDRPSDPVATVLTLLAHVSPDRREPLLKAVAKACHPDGDDEMRPSGADTLAVAIGDLLALVRSNPPDGFWIAMTFEPGSSEQSVTNKRSSHTHTCARSGCGKTFTAVRSDAKYCSGRCRVAAHRGS